MRGKHSVLSGRLILPHALLLKPPYLHESGKTFSNLISSMVSSFDKPHVLVLWNI